MVASTLGATAFQKGLGAMHSLTHPAGGLLNTQVRFGSVRFVGSFARPLVSTTGVGGSRRYMCTTICVRVHDS